MGTVMGLTVVEDWANSPLENSSKTSTRLYRQDDRITPPLFFERIMDDMDEGDRRIY